MIVQQVGQCRALQQFLNISPAFFTILQPGVKIYDPRPAPSGMAASVAEPPLQCGMCGSEKGLLLTGDLRAGM